MFNIGPTEIIVILLLALIVFGPKRLPEIGRTVGKGLREFRQATQDVKDELSRTMSDEDDEDEHKDGAGDKDGAEPAAGAPPKIA